MREIISKIQTMRKEAGFEVMDKIMISYQADDKVAAIFDKYGDAIKADVLGLDVVAGSVDGYEKEWNINGETVLLGVKKESKEMSKSAAVFNKKKFINDVTETVRHMYRKQLKEASQQEIFQAVSYVVKTL